MIQFENVYLVGVGGAGSHLAKALAFLLAHQPADNRPALTLIDGDHIETKNLTRQLFTTADVDGMKASSMVAAIKPSMPSDFKLLAVNKFLDDNLASKGLLDRSLIIGAVDNHKTNNLIQRHCDTLQNVAFVCGTGSLEGGMVITHLKWKGIEITPKVWALQPSIETPTDRHPNEPDCARTAEEGSPQIITTNAFNAMTMLMVVQALIDNLPFPALQAFDIRKFKGMPQGPLTDPLAKLIAAGA